MFDNLTKPKFEACRGLMTCRLEAMLCDILTFNCQRIP